MNLSSPTLLKHIGRLFLLCVALSACSPEPRGVDISESDIALNNRGVALMGSFDYPGAVGVFTELIERRPDWTVAQINLAIAFKNRQEVDDAQRALEILRAVLSTNPDDVRANYNAGVIELYQGQVETAKAYFERTLANDPDDAYAHYYLGQCQLRLGDEQTALQSYLTAIELDPQLRSAYYSAALVMRRLGQSDAATRQLQAFQQLENNPTARLAEFKYTRMGPKSFAKVAGNNQAGKPTASDGPLFNPQQTLVNLPKTTVRDKLSIADVNQDGALDILLLDTVPQLYLGSEEGAGFTRSQRPLWNVDGDITAVAWGDIDNDGLIDAYLCRSGEDQLWQQTQPQQWQLSTAELGEVAKGACVDAAMLDADHDGDLDVLLLTQSQGADLINNNRDGSFRSLSDQLGDEANRTGGAHLLASDFDADRDMDLLFVRANDSHTVLLNDRLWEYRQTDGFAELESASILRFASYDLNADGQNELIGISADGTVTIWSSNENHQWNKKDIYVLDDLSTSDIDLVIEDIDGDLKAEILLLAAGDANILGLTDGDRWESIERIQFTGGKPVPMVRTDQGSSLVAVVKTDGENALVEWAPGSGRLNFVTLTLSGKHDAAETMRSNLSGIGTQVGVRVGAQWARADSSKNSSLAGYNLQPLAIGIGARQSADFVEIDWSDGVYQTELGVPAQGITSIAEEQRQLGSCPILFAWDGQRFDFVTDILGVGAQGFLVEPGTLLPPRPWEYVPFPPGSLKSKQGELQFKLTEPMEESSYIDAMTLHAWDIPQGAELLLDERMGTGGPEVTGEAYLSDSWITPTHAFDSAGNDVLAEIQERDYTAMSPGEIDRRFIGILERDETLTLEFDQPLEVAGDQTLLLVADSWVELPYSQTHFAAWQAGKEFGSVSLEAKTLNGDTNKETWVSVYPGFGIPAGMPRVMTLPLLDLPTGTVALRLTWNREIYWDRVRVAVAQKASSQAHSIVLKPKHARVEKSGFSRRITHAQRRPEYRYGDRRPFGDVRYPTGFYTVLGEMTELIDQEDDALAIIGPGEGIHVAFDEPDASPAGFERWYVLETRGWAKDKDLYTHTGNTVEPLPTRYPGRENPDRERLHQKYNVRFQSGR